MDLKEIQTLIKFISKSQVDEVSIERKDFKINIKRNQPAGSSVVTSAPVSAPVPQQVIVDAPAPTPIAPAAPVEPSADAAPAQASTGEPIKSPMIGTFYRRPSPDKPNFVEVGDMVEKGQVICIIEAMKLF